MSNKKIIKSTKSNKSEFIGKYKIIKKIGSGSYANIYKVQQKDKGDILVLKEIIIQGDEDEETLIQIHSESKLLSQLNSLYIIKYYDSFNTESTINIITEYCENGDLDMLIKKLIKAGKKMNEKLIWKFFIQISLGLYHLHNNNILHRDIKSKNIFLTKNNDAKIGDLGIAKKLMNTSHAHTFIGTPYYLSPELCKDLPYDEKSDVWALGCILYEMAALCHPFDASSQLGLYSKIINDDYKEIDSNYSPQLKKMIRIMLQKEATKRPKMKQIVQMSFFVSLGKQLSIKFDDIGLNVSNNNTKGKNVNSLLNNNDSSNHILNQDNNNKVAQNKSNIKQTNNNNKSQNYSNNVSNIGIKQIKIASVEIKQKALNNNNNKQKGSNSSDKRIMNEHIMLLKNSNSENKFIKKQNKLIKNITKKYINNQNTSIKKHLNENFSNLIKENNNNASKVLKVLGDNISKNIPQTNIQSLINSIKMNKKSENISQKNSKKVLQNNEYKKVKSGDDIHEIVDKMRTSKEQINNNINNKKNIKISRLKTIEQNSLEVSPKTNNNIIRSILSTKNNIILQNQNNRKSAQNIRNKNNNLNSNHNERISFDSNNNKLLISNPVVKSEVEKISKCNINKNNNKNDNKSESFTKVHPVKSISNNTLASSFTLFIDDNFEFNRNNNILSDSSSDNENEKVCQIDDNNKVIENQTEEEKKDLIFLKEKYIKKQNDIIQQMNSLSKELTIKILEIYKKTNEDLNDDETNIIQKMENIINNNLDESVSRQYNKCFFDYVMNDFKLKQALLLLEK